MRRSKITTSPPSECLEYVVTRETFNRFFDKPLPTSTFHDLESKGIITRSKIMSGRFLLNDSLRRMGLKEVPELPKPPPEPNLEGIVRLAFTLIDPTLFPAPSWLLNEDAINVKDADHSAGIANQHRYAAQAYSAAELKLGYFQGVLDGAFLLKLGTEGVDQPGYRRPCIHSEYSP